MLTSCNTFLPLVCLQAAELCQRLALQVLVSEDVSAALRADADVQKQVHSLLFHTAANNLQAGSCPAATELLKAALFYAGPATRAKTARALALCHTRLNMNQRAAEYLDIAARLDHQPSSLTHLARLQTLARLGDAAQVGPLQHSPTQFITQPAIFDIVRLSPMQAVAAIKTLTTCPDFHPSLIASMCQVAAEAQDPVVLKEALNAATSLLIQPDAAASSMEAGQEAKLLLRLVQAICACLQAAPARSSLHAELVEAVKLVAKRSKLLGKEAFHGGDVKQVRSLPPSAGPLMQALTDRGFASQAGIGGGRVCPGLQPDHLHAAA